MAVLSTVGFDPAPDFPQTPYDAVHLRLARFADDSGLRARWRQFAGAWNAVAYRFQACAEYDEAFRELFARLGSNAGGLDRYCQERDTYGCVVNACSVIEAFYYAAYAVGGLIEPTVFQIGSAAAQKKVTPTTTANAYESKFPGDPFSHILGEVVADTDWTALNDLRNVLVHRAAWSKDVFRSVGEGPAIAADRVRLSDYHLGDRDLGPDLTARPRSWVAQRLDVLCLAFDRFTQREIPESRDSA